VQTLLKGDNPSTHGLDQWVLGLFSFEDRVRIGRRLWSSLDQWVLGLSPFKDKIRTRLSPPENMNASPDIH